MGKGEGEDQVNCEDVALKNPLGVEKARPIIEKGEDVDEICDPPILEDELLEDVEVEFVLFEGEVPSAVSGVNNDRGIPPILDVGTGEGVAAEIANGNEGEGIICRNVPFGFEIAAGGNDNDVKDKAECVGDPNDSNLCMV